jgi:hypothetical protein
MLSDLKRRIVAKERVTSQLAASSILPKSIWDRTLNGRPVVSGRLKLKNGRLYENLKGYENLLVRGLELPVDIVKHILGALRKLRRSSAEAMDAWMASRSVGRIVDPQSMHDVNPSSWGHQIWRNTIVDGPSHLITPIRVYKREGGLGGGPYWLQSSIAKVIQGPWGAFNPSQNVIGAQLW